MRAAYLTGANQFEIKDVKQLSPPNGGVVLEVRACGVCGSDLRRWREGPGKEPVIPGHEIAGVVVEVGKEVADYSVGDRLALAPDIHCGKCYYCRRNLFNLCDELHFLGITTGYPGGFAEQMILTAEVLSNGVVHRMPDGMSFTSAALAEPCSSVLAAHDHACTGLGDNVLVMGAGPIGCLHIAVAKARGAKVMISEPSASRREMSLAFDPDLVINPNEDDLAEMVMSSTGRVGADIVICANPVAATQTQAVEVVRKGGKVVLFGGLPKKSPNTVFDGNRIHYGEIEVVGAFSYHPSFHALALRTIQHGLVQAEKVITEVLPLDEIDQAFQLASQGNALKVMVAPSKGGLS
jgi:L-iditol 2-dehydrogenase